MCHEVQRRLECDAASVRIGRHFVIATLERWGVTDDDVAYPVTDDLVLVASELLTNAIRVCAGPIALRMSAHRDHVELSVIDDSTFEVTPKQLTAFSPGGRGLGIVAEISEAWGQRTRDDGTKEVWCRLAVPPGSRIGDYCTIGAVSSDLSC